MRLQTFLEQELSAASQQLWIRLAAAGWPPRKDSTPDEVIQEFRRAAPRRQGDNGVMTHMAEAASPVDAARRERQKESTSKISGL